MGERFFKYGELALVLLALLDREKMTAYRLMQVLDELFGDSYQASPGTVYPAVSILQREGLVRPRSLRGPLSLSKAGQEALANRSHKLAELEARTGVRVRTILDVSVAVEGFAAEVHAMASELDAGQVQAILTAALADLRNGKVSQ